MTFNTLQSQNNEKGFTLIELMIVIAIIGILAAVAIPNFIAYRDKAYCSAAEKDANSIAAALADYFAIPSHTSLEPTLQLISNLAGGFTGGTALTAIFGPTSSPKFSALSGKNIAIVTNPSDVAQIQIIVRDGSKRCPKDYVDAQSGAGWTWDNGNNQGTFTKEMK